MRRAALAVAVTTLLAGACAEPTIPREEAQGLQTVVARIRSAAEAGKISAARNRLVRLTDQVEQLLAADVIAQDTAMEIIDAAAAVRAELSLAPTSSTTPTESVSPTPSPEEETDEDHGNKGGKGKGKGHGDEGHGNDD
jgi:hypothetical protein